MAGGPHNPRGAVLVGLLAFVMAARSCRDQKIMHDFLSDCPQASASRGSKGLGWSEDKDVCNQWPGVVCGSKPNQACKVVTEISFSAMGIGHRPCKIDRLGGLVNLTKLTAFGIDARTNKLDTMSDNWIHMFTLNLKNNKKVTGGFPEFRGNHVLKKLNLKDTGLSGTLPAWRHLNELEELDLDNTVISGPCPDFARYMSKHLQTLHISGPDVQFDAPLPIWDLGAFRRRGTEVEIIIMDQRMFFDRAHGKFEHSYIGPPVPVPLPDPVPVPVPLPVPLSVPLPAAPHHHHHHDPSDDTSGDKGVVIFLSFFLSITLAISYLCLSAMYKSIAFKTFLYNHLPGVRRSRRQDKDSDSVGSDDELDLVDSPPTPGSSEMEYEYEEHEYEESSDPEDYRGE